MKLNYVKFILLSLLSGLVVSCSKDTKYDNNENMPNIDKLNYNSNYFPNIYEFDMFLESESNHNVKSNTFENEFVSINVVDPAPATYEIGQKHKIWVSSYSPGYVLINFKQDVNNFVIDKMIQNTYSSTNVGVINSLFTPLKADGSLEKSCFLANYKAGETCKIAFIYKGTSTSQSDQTDIVSMNFISKQFTVPLVAKIVLHNSNASNNQNVGILDFNNNLDGINVLQQNLTFNKGNLVNDDVLAVTFKNMGDDVIGKKDDGSVVSVGVGISNPSVSLRNISYLNNKSGNPVNCALNVDGEVNPLDECQLTGILPTQTDKYIKSYYLNLVFKYQAQSSIGAITPISFMTMYPAVVSVGAFHPQNYNLDGMFDVFKSSYAYISNVVGNNLAYSPYVSDVKFYLTKDLGIFIPYSMNKDDKILTYDIDNNKEFLLSSGKISDSHELDNITLSDDVYEFNFVEAIRESKQKVVGGLLKVVYTDSENKEVQQIIGSVNINNDIADPVAKLSTSHKSMIESRNY